MDPGLERAQIGRSPGRTWAPPPEEMRRFRRSAGLRWPFLQFDESARLTYLRALLAWIHRSVLVGGCRGVSVWVGSIDRLRCDGFVVDGSGVEGGLAVAAAGWAWLRRPGRPGRSAVTREVWASPLSVEGWVMRPGPWCWRLGRLSRRRLVTSSRSWNDVGWCYTNRRSRRQSLGGPPLW